MAKLYSHGEMTMFKSYVPNSINVMAAQVWYTYIHKHDEEYQSANNNTH